MADSWYVGQRHFNLQTDNIIALPAMDVLGSWFTAMPGTSVARSGLLPVGYVRFYLYGSLCSFPGNLSNAVYASALYRIHARYSVDVDGILGAGFNWALDCYPLQTQMFERERDDCALRIGCVIAGESWGRKVRL